MRGTVWQAMWLLLALAIVAKIVYWSSMPSDYWRTDRIDNGSVRVVCLNDSDPTVVASGKFGELVVSCGSR